jgi:low affinity Fe/Cu permease
VLARLEPAIAVLARFLASTVGFTLVVASVLISIAILFFGSFSDSLSLGVNLYLSILAIVISGIVLLQNDKDTTALQAKLDEILLRLPGANDSIGLEHATQAEIQAMREGLEQAAQQGSV